MLNIGTNSTVTIVIHLLICEPICSTKSSQLSLITILLTEYFCWKGTDVAGEILQVGLGVKDFKVGDKVIAKLQHGVIFSLPLTLLFMLVNFDVFYKLVRHSHKSLIESRLMVRRNKE